MSTLDFSDLKLEIKKQTSIDASPELVFEAMLEEITQGMDRMHDQPLKLRLEAWPGGRYFRDLGNNTGHLWGHVQVIKPPKLLEISGPLFMSSPAFNHVQYRIVAEGSGSTLSITHRGFGWIDPEYRKGVDDGWQQELECIKQSAERRRSV